MNLASFVASKCLEYLLSEDSGRLRQQTARRRTPLYPPWSPAAEVFSVRCTGCGDCAAVCENGIIVLGEDRLPTVDFSKNGCTFCGKCAQSCQTDALHFDETKRPWNVRAVVDSACLLAKRVLCRSCGDCCAQGAFVFPQAETKPPTVLIEKCTGCGDCARVCPAGAIFFSA